MTVSMHPTEKVAQLADAAVRLHRKVGFAPSLAARLAVAGYDVVGSLEWPVPFKPVGDES